MPFNLKRPSTRFQWSALRGRCRRRIAVGLVLLIVGGCYAAYAGQRFGTRGNDEGVFDQELARLGHVLTPPPVHMRGISPANDRELYLMAVIKDQQDITFGLTMLVLRMIATLTVGGIGLVLLTAGSTEWEIRSEAG
jgi:hypothetical protein